MVAERSGPIHWHYICGGMFMLNLDVRNKLSPTFPPETNVIICSSIYSILLRNDWMIDLDYWACLCLLSLPWWKFDRSFGFYCRKSVHSTIPSEKVNYKIILQSVFVLLKISLIYFKHQRSKRDNSCLIDWFYRR